MSYADRVNLELDFQEIKGQSSGSGNPISPPCTTDGVRDYISWNRNEVKERKAWCKRFLKVRKELEEE